MADEYPQDTKTPVIIDGMLFNMHAMVGAWVNERLGSGTIATPFYAIGILRPGKGDGAPGEDIAAALGAGAYFHSHHMGIEGTDDDGKPFTWSKVYCAVVADDVTVANPHTIRKVLQYPFGVLKVDIIMAEISMSNKRAIRSAEKLGFVRYCEISGVVPGGEIGVFGLRRDLCKLWNDGPIAEAA